VTASHLPTLLASQTPRPVHALGLDTITAGAHQLAARFQALRTPTGAIVVCDAVTDAHLAVIAEAARLLGEGCLLAGSAGLARPLAALHAEQVAEQQAAHILLVIGSIHPIVRQQLHELVRQSAAYVVSLDLTAAADDALWTPWLAHALHRLENAPPDAPIVVTAPATPVTPAQDACCCRAWPSLPRPCCNASAYTASWRRAAQRCAPSATAGARRGLTSSMRSRPASRWA
jgi:uncharacterized protein YgbK (DUF1537 family)